MVYIPTNRACENAIKAYAEEVRWIQASHHSSVLVVVESDEGEWVEANSRTLSACRKELGVACMHLDPPAQARFVHLLGRAAGLSDHEYDWLAGRLLPDAPSYTSGPNKAALLSCALGAAFVHRRDSDTFPIESDGQIRFPAAMELKALGKPLREVCPPGAWTGTHDDTVVAAVGTSYHGDEALDRREFAKVAPRLLVEHERILRPDASDELLERIVERKYGQNDDRRNDRDEIVPDLDGLSEMGCIAFLQDEAITPELPIHGTLGSDYFHKNLLYRLGLPILYHRSKVGHLSGRGEIASSREAYGAYACRDLRFKLVKSIWRTLNEAIVKATSGEPASLTLSFIAGTYRDCLLSTIADVHRGDLRTVVLRTAWIYGEAAAVAHSKAQRAACDRFGDAQKIMLDAGEAMIDEVLRAFVDYAELARLWPILCRTAKMLGPDGLSSVI